MPWALGEKDAENCRGRQEPPKNPKGKLKRLKRIKEKRGWNSAGERLRLERESGSLKSSSFKGDQKLAVFRDGVRKAGADAWL